jgi:ATP-dependent Clp protease ATP-binding subunit ClpC
VFNNFTERANHTVMLAEEEARKLGHKNVGTGMLLLAVVVEGGAASRILDGFGVKAENVREEVVLLMGKGAGSGRAELEFSENAKDVFAFATAEAAKRTIKDVAVPHILLGLLNGKDTVATRVFDVMGIRLDDVKVKAFEELDIVYGPRLASG